MNDNNVIRDGRKELGILCYKAPILPVKQHNAIKLDLVVNIYFKLKPTLKNIKDA